VTANDGENAVRVALDQRPHVIVMDLSMPRLDGIDATRRIKRDRRARRGRVIILTGYPYKAIERGALESGADMFLTKPCLPEDLERHVRDLLKPPTKA
jgi:two-component system, cell cycle response regulator DivK